MTPMASQPIAGHLLRAKDLAYAVVPVCIVRAFSRPQNRTFREDTARP